MGPEHSEQVGCHSLRGERRGVGKLNIGKHIERRKKKSGVGGEKYKREFMP